MPELPEVETIKNQLNKLVKGKTFRSFEAANEKSVKTEIKSFKMNLKDRKIEDIKRRAKIFLFELSGGQTLLVHLKMTGQLVFAKDKKDFNDKKNKHTRAVFSFKDGSFLLFNDLRKFGWLKLVKSENAAEEIKEGQLGPEPLEKTFSLELFQGILKKRPNKKIKQLLMDPYLIAGIGNIYSDEILFLSRVHPVRQTKNLKPREIKKIYENIGFVLKEALKARGTSASDYLDARGKEGGYDKKLRVYGKKKENCPICGTKIEWLKLNGRSAHFCPKCQN